MRKTETILDAHYADLPCPVIVREVETGRITYANAAPAELAGVDEPGAMMGQAAADTWPGNADRWREADLEALRRGSTTRRVEAGRGHWLRVRRRALGGWAGAGGDRRRDPRCATSEPENPFRLQGRSAACHRR